MSTALILFSAQDPAAMAAGIGVGALTFMLVSMTAVTLLTAWCFARVLATRSDLDREDPGAAPARATGIASDRERV